MEGFRRSRNRRRPPQRVGPGAEPAGPAPDRGGAVGPATSVGEDLHVCPRCTSPLVQPAEWKQVDARHWRVSLLCPECEWLGGGVFTQSVLDRYDEVLDDGAAVLVQELHALAQANMEADVEAFAAALAADGIQPDDF